MGIMCKRAANLPHLFQSSCQVKRAMAYWLMWLKSVYGISAYTRWSQLYHDLLWQLCWITNKKNIFYGNDKKIHTFTSSSQVSDVPAA